MEASSSAKHRPYALIATLAASSITFFFGLGTLGFLGPDEPRYAEVAREMFASGDLISTRLCGCLWFEKPALLYWTSAAGYRIFGVNEFAARVPTAVAALATVALLYYALRRSGLPNLGLAASLVLGTSGIFIAYARVATPDMMLAAAMTAALLFGYLAAQVTGKSRRVCWVMSFGFMGLAVLAKGLVGIVLVLAILGCYLMVSGRLGSIDLRDAALGVLIFLVVAGTWYLPVTLRHGWSFIEEFFVRHHFERFSTNEFGHPQPVYFFPLVALAGAAPWTFFLVPALARLRSLRPRDDARDSLLMLAWLWVALPLLFFSFSESKLPGYILPVSPALAVIIGAEVERLWRKDRGAALRIAAWASALMLAAAGIGFIVYLRRESVGATGWRAALAYLPAAMALVAIARLALARNRAFTGSAAAVVASLVVAAVILVFPKLGEEVSLKTLSLEAAAALKPGEKIGFYLKKEFAPVFYAEGRVLCEPRRGTTFYALHQNMVADALQSEPSLLLITDSHWVDGLKGDPRFTTEEVRTQGDSVAIRVTLKR